MSRSRSLLSLFQRFILRDLWRNKTRSILTVAGIMLGVAILLSIRLANTSAVYHFEDSINRVAGKTNLEITSPSLPVFDENAFTQIQWLWDDFVKFTPVLEHPAVINLDNNNDGVTILGVDMLSDNAFREYDWQEGSDNFKPEDLFEIFKPAHVFIGQKIADRYDLIKGSTFPVSLNDQSVELTVAGVLSDKGLGGALGGSLIIMDIAPAQELTNNVGKLSRIDLIVPDAVKKTVTEKLSEQFSNTLTIATPARRSQQVEKMLTAYQYNLTVLSFIALLVGAFLIYNTMAITIIRRRHEIGTLRALGVTKNTITLLFLLEASFIGIVGTLLGLLLGTLMAQGALQAISATVEALYVGQPVESLSLPPQEYLWAFIFGIGVTVAGSLVPVFEAASVPPAEATRRASYEAKIIHLKNKLFLLGAVLLVIGVWAAFQPPVNGVPAFGFVSALMLILGFSLIMPSFLYAFFNATKGLLSKLLKTEGKLAVASLNGSLGRTAVAVASLMTGIAMMVSLAVMIGSFRDTVVTWVDQSFQAELWIEPLTRGNGRQVVTLSETSIKTIEATEGIKALDRFYQFPIDVVSEDTNTKGQSNLAVGEFDVFRQFGRLKFLDGRSTETVIEEALNDDKVIVTEAFETKFNLGKGDTVTLNTPTGKQSFPIAGVYYDYTSERGNIVMNRSLYQQIFNDNTITGIAVYVENPDELEAIRSDILSRLPEGAQVLLQTNGELKTKVMTIFDRTFTITYALHIIAIAVAILSIMNALFALVMEARRELGLLKYIGASREQLHKMVLTQAALLGFLGNLTGLIAGFILSFLLIYVINKQSFGWTIQFHMPWFFLLQSFLLVMITAILSGLIPAKLASKTPAPEVLRHG